MFLYNQILKSTKSFAAKREEVENLLQLQELHCVIRFDSKSAVGADDDCGGETKR